MQHVNMITYERTNSYDIIHHTTYNIQHTAYSTAGMPTHENGSCLGSGWCMVHDSVLSRASISIFLLTFALISARISSAVFPVAEREPFVIVSISTEAILSRGAAVATDQH